MTQKLLSDGVTPSYINFQFQYNVPDERLVDSKYLKYSLF